MANSSERDPSEAHIHQKLVALETTQKNLLLHLQEIQTLYGRFQQLLCAFDAALLQGENFQAQLQRGFIYERADATYWQKLWQEHKKLVEAWPTEMTLLPAELLAQVFNLKTDHGSVFQTWQLKLSMAAFSAALPFHATDPFTINKAALHNLTAFRFLAASYLRLHRCIRKIYRDLAPFTHQILPNHILSLKKQLSALSIANQNLFATESLQLFSPGLQGLVLVHA